MDIIRSRTQSWVLGKIPVTNTHDLPRKWYDIAVRQIISTIKQVKHNMWMSQAWLRPYSASAQLLTGTSPLCCPDGLNFEQGSSNGHITTLASESQIHVLIVHFPASKDGCYHVNCTDVFLSSSLSQLFCLCLQGYATPCLDKQPGPCIFSSGCMRSR